VIGFIEKLYAKVYINVVIENIYANVYVTVEKMGRTILQETKHFDIEKGELSKELIHYIERFERKSPFSYVSVLNSRLEQGATAQCESDKLKDQAWLCLGSKNNPWAITVDTATLQNIQKQFKSTGIDYIFSPYSVVAIATKEIKKDKAQMFVLILEKSMSVSVFRNGSLEFAQQFSLEEEHNEFDLDGDDDDLMLDAADETMDLNIDLDSDLSMYSDEEALDDLEGLDDLDDHDDLEGLEDLDDLEGLEDLDELGDDEVISDFSDDDEDAEMEEETEDEEESEISLSGFSRNFKRFELIQEGIHQFYHAGDVESSFIEDVYLLDPYEDCSDLSSYLEDELFVTVHFRKPDLDQILTALAKSEIKDAS
jgi:hypothetical protein